MKTWMIFGGGGVLGAVIGLSLAATGAQGTTADEARITALEARIATLETSITVVKDGPTTVKSFKTIIVNGKKFAVAADDEISLTTGKATLTMRKSGEIEISGTKITVKEVGGTVVKGSKINQN